MLGDKESESKNILESIWDDIENVSDIIPIVPITYKASSLSNILYEVIDNREKRHQIIKTSQIKGRFGDVGDIRKHRDMISVDSKINKLLQIIFMPEEIPNITPLDRIFLNSFYRKLLRAKLEREYNQYESSGNSNIMNLNLGNDIIATLKLLRIICRYLGITSTTEEITFPLELLYSPKFWESLSNKFVLIFGEERITPIETKEDKCDNSVAGKIMHEGQKKICQSQALFFLQTVFNIWSGTYLVLENQVIKVIPATYVVLMLPKLRSIY